MNEKKCASCKKIYCFESNDFSKHFYKDRSKKCGFHSRCRDCSKKRHKKLGSKWSRENYPDKYKARYTLNNAIARGLILKPKSCSKCNSKSRIHGHHDDYSKPLEVLWFCDPCHKKHHVEINK